MRRVIGSVFYFPLIIVWLLLTGTEFWHSLLWMCNHLQKYIWFFIGLAAYIVLRTLIPVYRKNESFFEVFSHELTHTVVGLLFFRKIHSFEAQEKEGVIVHSSRFSIGDRFIGLAPYYLPIFTFIMLIIRIICANKMLYVMDILIGLTLGFHLHCFLTQTRNYQTDISDRGYVKSYLFIAAFLMFNLTVILMSVRLGIVEANVRLFTAYWSDMKAAFAMIF